MPRAAANGMELEFDTFGDPADPCLLLVAGLGTQMTSWDDVLCTAFADRGRFVVRYDNRDVGLSTWLDDEVDMAALMQHALAGGPRPDVPYLLSDMAADGIGLLDVLGVDRAHILGSSMGGMIVQTMAIERPERVLTLTSVMSTTGEPEFGQPTAEAMVALLTPPPATRAEYLDNAVTTWRVWASKRYFDEERTRTKAAAFFDRAFHPAGTQRQMAAVVASGSRAEGLRGLRVPTLVIHGHDDTLIAPSGGFRTAELVPGANLLYLHDMGHDLPEPLWPLIVDAVTSHQNHAVA
jgi:pimeloyl-ACP methyl ester carboxylesterase